MLRWKEGDEYDDPTVLPMPKLPKAVPSKLVATKPAASSSDQAPLVDEAALLESQFQSEFGAV